MRRLSFLSAHALFGACAALGACAEPIAPSTTNVAIQVAPLELEGVTNARYTVTVTAGGETVWTKQLDAKRYGDGRGSLAYVGPCDASLNAQPNTVTLVLDALEGASADIPASTWQNPTPVSLKVTCKENADTQVLFDLVIMRDATQGFFDVAVEFEDVFCSAKFDCQDSLLHNGEERGLTGVLAFACAAGTAQETVLYMSDVTVTCDGLPPVVVNPALGPGQRTVSEAPLFAVGTYWGKENFDDLDKCYWNTALGLTLSPEGAVNPHNCKVSATGTAAGGALPAHTTPGATRYPIIEWNVPVTDTDGNLLCAAHPLNNPNLTVRTRYSDLAGEVLDHPYSCGGRPGQVCAGNTPQVAGADITVSELGDGALRVEIGTASTEIRLPPDTVLDNDIGCCIAPCCNTAGD